MCKQSVDYAGVNYVIVWDVVARIMPGLEKQIIEVVNELGKTEHS